MAFWEDDLDMFFADFGEDAVYNSSTIKVIFDNTYQVVDLGTGSVESANPRVRVKSSDVSGITHGATLTIRSIAYKVIEIQPDGTGLTTLILSKD